MESSHRKTNNKFSGNKYVSGSQHTCIRARCSLSFVISNGCALLLCCHTYTQHNDDIALHQIDETITTTTKRSHRIENEKNSKKIDEKHHLRRLRCRSSFSFIK